MLLTFPEFMSEDREFEKKHPRAKAGKFSKKPARPVRKNPDWEGFMNAVRGTDVWWKADVLRDVPLMFPNADSNTVNVVRMGRRHSNCIAHAFGDTHRWWWPDAHYWPYVPKEKKSDIAHFDDLIQWLGGSVETSIHEDDFEDRIWEDKFEYEKGFIKIALFAKKMGVAQDIFPTHMARLMPNGKWSSKLGSDPVIEHTLADVYDGQYGNPIRIYKVPKDRVKEMLKQVVAERPHKV